MNGVGCYAVAIGISVGLTATALEVATADAEFCPTHCSSGKVPLGISAPTSGPSASFGQQAVKSVEVAIRELNAAGGLMGIPVSLIVDDDRCDPGLAATVAKRQIDKEKISAAIGPVCPPAASAAARIYAEAGVLQLLPTVPVLEPMRQSSEKIFRLVVTDEQEAHALGTYLASEQKGKKVTIVYRNAFYRREMIENIKSALPVEMQETAQFKPVLSSSGAYDQLADQLTRDQPDIIYLAVDNDMIVELVGKLRTRGVTALLISGQRLLSQAFWSTANKAAEGIYMIAPVDSPTRLEFRKTIDQLAQAKIVPDLVALNSYATVQTWAEAVRRAGSGDPTKVVAALRDGEYQTAIGLVAFDKQGERRGVQYSVLTWDGGRLKSVK
jgi:branched-chain amino acid transport system substrate-binding protein